MSKSNVIRAWKDPAYRNSLSQAERTALPANPAGAIEISDTDLGKTAGGRPPLSQDGACPTQICSLINGNCSTSWPICQQTYQLICGQ